jgi:hypothetical protein
MKETKSAHITVRLKESEKAEFIEYCKDILNESNLSKVILDFVRGLLETKKKILEKYQK